MPTTKPSVKKAATGSGKPSNPIKKTPAKQDALSQRKQAPSFITPQKEMVTIHVTNTDGEVFDFVVHKSFICYTSPFFDAAFNGTLVEGQTQTMKLETSEQAFGMLVDYAYSGCKKFCQRTLGKITCYNKSCCPSTDKAHPPPKHINHLIELWVLADKLLMPKLQNVVMNEIYSFAHVVFDEESRDIEIINFNIFYNNTSSGSPLRLLAVMIFNSCCDDDHVEDMIDLPREMVLELYASFRAHYGNIAFDEGGTAEYHVSDAVPPVPVAKVE